MQASRTTTKAARSRRASSAPKRLGLTRVLGLAALVSAALLGTSACTSRTLPLPPPIVQELSAPDMDGMVRVTGLCNEGASVGVMNDITQEGTVVTSHEDNCDSSCPFQARVRAEAGDPLRVWQFFETESSIHVTVPAR